MSAIAHLPPDYRHHPKQAVPQGMLRVGASEIKYYHLEKPGEPVPDAISHAARAFLTDEGGEFTRVNAVDRRYVARLNPTGSIDTGFDPFTGPNAPVSDIELEPGESLLISGDFNTVRGVLNNRVARL